MRWVTWLLDLLYPPRCIFCRKLLKEHETEICNTCRRFLPELERPIQRGRYFKRCYTLYEYAGDVKASVRRFKFHGMRHYAQAYGRQLAMLLLRQKAEFDLISWVPVSNQRRRQRGYDQAELVARAVAKELQVPCIRTLKKVRDNAPQTKTESADERRANVIGAYQAVEAEKFIGKRILLIDDVITTGATLSECSSVLLMAGALQVEAATVAAVMMQEKRNQ